jgi:hypothetical protein
MCMCIKVLLRKNLLQCGKHGTRHWRHHCFSYRRSKSISALASFHRPRQTACIT